MTCARDGCARPVATNRRRYCSARCYRAADAARNAERARQRYQEDPAYRLAQLAKRRRAELAVRADPERQARRRAYMREYRRAHREQAREHQRAYRARLLEDARRLQARRAREAERMRRRRAEDPELYRRRSVESYARLRSDPAAWAQRLEWQRMYYRLRAMRDGRPVRALSSGAYERRNGAGHRGSRLDPEPLAAWIRRWLGEDAGHDRSLLGERAGLDPRRIYGVLSGERVSVNTADRLALGIGLHLGLIYNLDELRAG